MGWLSTVNGELLRRAEAAGLEAFVTADRNLEFQQNLSRYSLGIIVLLVSRTAPETVLPLVPHIEQALDQIEPGRVLHVGIDPRRSRS
jgi:hypothetical protein